MNCAEYGASYEAELLVTPDLQHEFLISLEDMGSLGLLSPWWPRNVCLATTESPRPSSLSEIMEEYKDILITELSEAQGGICGEKMKIVLKSESEVKPLQVYMARQVPLHYHKAYTRN